MNTIQRKWRILLQSAMLSAIIALMGLVIGIIAACFGAITALCIAFGCFVLFGLVAAILLGVFATTYIIRLGQDTVDFLKKHF